MKTTPCKVIKKTTSKSFAYLDSPRCGAKTRKGHPCKSPTVKGKKRCRMHGCAKGSGAPRKNQNALKHGYMTLEAKLARKAIKILISKVRVLLEETHEISY